MKQLEEMIKDNLLINNDSCPYKFLVENNGKFVRYSLYNAFGIVHVTLLMEKLNVDNIEICVGVISNILLSDFLHLITQV